MLRDDISLLCGKVIAGPLTPAIYLLLRDSPDMEQLCRDLKVRDVADDNTHRDASKPGEEVDCGLSLQEWISGHGKPVSL